MTLEPTQNAPRLRPMGIMDLLDVIFRLYRDNFLLFAGVVALLMVPVIILQSFAVWMGAPFFEALQKIQTAQLTGRIVQPDDLNALFSGPALGTYLLAAGVTGVIAGLFLQFIEGALANVIAQRYLGQKMSIFSAYGFGFGRGLSLVAASILRGLIVMVLIGIPAGGLFALVAGSIAVQSSSSRSSAPPAVGAILCAFPLLFLFALGVMALMLRFTFTAQSIVIEGKGAVSGLGRSWRLSQGAFWRILGLMVMMGILTSIISSIFSVLFQVVIGLVLPGLAKDLVIMQLLTTILTYIVQIFIMPLSLGINTLLYFDLRVRKEAFDLQLLNAAQDTLPVSEHDSGMPPLIS